MKKTILALAFLVMAGLLCACGDGNAGETGTWQNPYADVTADMWSYDAIEKLTEEGILVSDAAFAPAVGTTRGDLILWLSRMSGQTPSKDAAITFQDVPQESPYYGAVLWAEEKGIVGNGAFFRPDDPVTRGEACALLIRYADAMEIELKKVSEPTQFTDSLRIDPTLRSGVTAANMAGLVNGEEDGGFHPKDPLPRQNCAVMLARLWQAQKEGAGWREKLVDTSANAYDDLYDSYQEDPFLPPVPASEEVDPSWFQDAIVIGDSVSVMLENYCHSSGALGNASFLCTVSLSQTNALKYQAGDSRLPEYPAGSGQHPKVEDAVAASGATKVYVMLGVNCLSSGVDRASHDLVLLIGRIWEKVPTVSIFVESVTPMTADSPRADQLLNNGTIATFNETMQNLCQQNGWYFVNVAEAVGQADGTLNPAFSGDTAMGIHFNYDGAATWAEYLRTHVPAALK